MQTFKPPMSVAKEGRRALKWLKERKEGKGFTRVGYARAIQLAKQKPISFNTVKRMHSYLSRHQIDKKAEGFYKGQKSKDSKVIKKRRFLIFTKVSN